MSKPPVFKIPPAPNKAPKGTPWQQFVNYWGAKYSQFKANAPAILAAAQAEHLDPVVFGALVLNESGGNFKVGNSSAGAVGIGQLEPGTFIGPNAWNGGVLPWNTSHKITAADLRNPAVNLRLSAAYYGYLQGQYPADAYGRYNAGPNASDALAGQIQAGFTQKWIAKWNPKYVPGQGVSTAPPSAAGQQVPGGSAPPSLDVKDPWIVQTAKGFKFVNATSPPPGTVEYGGQPITRSQYNQIWNQNYSDTFFAYTGRHATPHEITTILATAPSIYSLSNQLASGSSFDKSPVFKQHAPGLIGLARTILGQGWKPSGGIIRQAIAQNWDQATFEQHLRELPAYRQGPEFKDNQAKTQQVYESIYGKADPGAQKLIADVTAQGWTPDEFASWLRSQDAYTATPEYQSKQVSFLQALGLITGAPATLTGDQVTAMQNNAPTDPFAPNPGASPKRPDNRPGPRGANPGGVSPPTNPTPAAPVRPNDRPGPYGPGR